MIPKATYFECTQYSTDWSKGSITFTYTTGLENGENLEFTEQLTINEEIDLSLAESTSVKNILEMLHILLGMSYFKAHIAPEIRHPYTHTQEQAEFWNKMYTHGLGEFFYKNNIDFRGLITFPFSDSEEHETPNSNFDDKALVLFGGGKDSIVSTEILKTTDIEYDIFAMNASTIQEIAADAVGKDLNVVTRKIDSSLVQITDAGEAYYGHVPITAMYSTVATLYALLKGYRYVITSNEKSADYGNVEFLDITVNHQWSKSLEAEEMLAHYYSSYVDQGLQYFSLLRSMHEIKIIEIFSRYPQYFESFSSSNHNFTQDASGQESRWSVEYSKGKVEFVWALMSAFLSKDDMMRTFQENVYMRDDRLDVFKELLGTKDIKPLDCVGTPEEMKAAMALAHRRGEFDDTPIMQYFIESVYPHIHEVDSLVSELLNDYDDSSRIPEPFAKAASTLASGKSA